MTYQEKSFQELIDELCLRDKQLQCLQDAYQRLSKSEKLYRTLVELAADAILMGDRQGNIVGSNHSATTLSGYPEEELRGMNISRLFSPDVLESKPLRFDLLQQGKVIQAERLLLRRNGTTVPVSMHSKMMPDGTYHTLMRDISEQKILELKMRETHRELEAFVYTVSHDLRTPLGPIIGYTDLLREQYGEVLDETALDILDEIQKSGSGMLSLMEDILSLACAGELERPNGPVESRDVIEETIKNLGLAATDIRISSHPAVHLPRTLLSQIFGNLIGNAVRHCGQVGFPIEVGGDHFGQKARFYVRDYGPGIPSAERERVFDVFYRGRSAEKRQGTGLGLAIVQKIARSYGGSAWLEETPGGGCTFWVEMEDIIP